MAAVGDVTAYCPTPEKCPRLCKAQRAFASAEMLREKDHYECAANRYYYAIFHAATHFVGEGYLKHDELWLRYTRDHDPQAYRAVERAKRARERADYTECALTAKELALVIMPVADMIDRAMTRAGVRRKQP
jgi:uncharacterized protein (UPF0332 family)